MEAKTCKPGTFESIQRTTEGFNFVCPASFNECSKKLILERSSDCKVKWSFGGGAPCTSGTAIYDASNFTSFHHWDQVDAASGTGSTYFNSENNEVTGWMPWGNSGAGCPAVYVVPGWDNDKPVGTVMPGTNTLVEECLKLGIDPSLCNNNHVTGAHPPMSPGAKAGVAVGVIGGLTIATAIGLTLANQLCGLKLSFACCKKADVTVFSGKKDKSQQGHGGVTKPKPTPHAAAAPAKPHAAGQQVMYPAMAPISGDLANANKSIAV